MKRNNTYLYTTISILIILICINIWNIFHEIKEEREHRLPFVIDTAAETVSEQMFLSAAQLSYAKHFKRNACWKKPINPIIFLPIRECTPKDLETAYVAPCYFPYYSSNFYRMSECTILSGGKFQDERFFKYEKKHVKKYFKPPEPEHPIEKAQKMEAENSVAVFVKRGDYIDKHFPIMSISYYDKAIDYVAKKAGQDIKLYVFTDDPEWVKQYFPNKYPYEIIISDKTGKFDIYLATKCHHVILGNYDAAWWGAYLNNHKNKIVVAPDEWSYEQYKNGKDTPAKGWKVIPANALPGGKIAIIHIATGRYIFFWDNFYTKMEKYFIPELPKTYFLFTDNTSKAFPKNVKKIYQAQEPWPGPTLHRYRYMNSIRETLLKYDWVYFFNANADPQKYIGKEVIPTKEQKLVFTIHPIYYGHKDKPFFQFERDPASAAYIPYEEGDYYVIGGLNGGRSADYMEMIGVLEKRVDIDLNNHFIPVWHDESHLNKYHTDFSIQGNKPLRLNPSYSTFEELLTTPEFPGMHKFRKDPHLIFIDKQKIGGRKWFREIDKDNVTPPKNYEVSVVIPVYNNEKTLQRAIDSIKQQTYTDWELVIVDDNSTDNTKEILKRYKSDSQIRVIKNTKRVGLAASLNTGMTSTTGKYIAIMSAEDTSSPDRLQRQVSVMRKSGISLLAGKIKGDDFFNTPSEDDFDSSNIGMNLLIKNSINKSTVMLNKDFLVTHNLLYNDYFKNAEDYNLWLTIFLRGGKLAIMGGEPVANYGGKAHSKEWINLYDSSAIKAREDALRHIIPDYYPKMLDMSLCQLTPIIIQGNKKTKILNSKELKKFEKKYCNKK